MGNPWWLEMGEADEFTGGVKQGKVGASTQQPACLFFLPVLQAD
jgi:hypothetical protein